MQIYTLSAQERSEVWTQLTPDQKEVFNTYTMDRVTSELLTRSFRMSSRWRLISVNIDYGWEMRKKTGNHHGYQYCECGRKLKYQYELESVKNPKKHLLLGSTHFAEEAGIPTKIALEIQGRVNEIQIYMDEILYRYKHGDRFREDRFGYLFDLGIMDEPTHFNTKIKAFRDAGLPLFHVDQNRMYNIASNNPRPKIQTMVVAPKLEKPVDPAHTYKTATEPKLKRKSLQIPEGANLNIRSLRAVNDANAELTQTHARNMQLNFAKFMNQYFDSIHLKDRPTYGKIMAQVTRHIVKMLPKANQRGVFTTHFNEQYWAPLYRSLKHYTIWTFEDTFGVSSPRAPQRQKTAILFRLLSLEQAMWLTLLDGKTPSVPWQIAQLARMSFLMARIPQTIYPHETVKMASQLSKKFKRMHDQLKLHPSLYSDQFGEEIQQLYKAILDPEAGLRRIKGHVFQAEMLLINQ